MIVFIYSMNEDIVNMYTRRRGSVSFHGIVLGPQGSEC